MPSVTIRPATERDAATISTLLVTLGYPSSEGDVERRITEHIASPRSTVLVAESETSVVGVLSFQCIPTFHANGFLGRITSLVVDPAFRRRGIGQALVVEAEEFGRTHGCARIEVTSGDHRADAHAFYERLGYHSDCRRFIKPAAVG